MNRRRLLIFKGLSYTFLSNVISLGISVVLTLIIPKVVGVESYGYWQLYLFYVTYTAYSSLGFCEGTYLKYGGRAYKDLNGRVVASQFWTLAVFEVLFSLVCGFCSWMFVADEQKSVILCLALISSIFDILRYLLQSVLQATNRIKEFAGVMTSERVLFFVFLMITLFLGYRDYRLLILSEILARIISMIYAMILCRDKVFVKFIWNRESLRESGELIRIGFKLLLATLASQLVIGIVRFMIELAWGTVVFGKVSLTLILSNMVITCIGAVSIVLFPILKNMEREKLDRLYETMRMILTVPVLFVLLLYAPMKLILTAWLPQYIESLRYLAVLLPICVYETRSYALINTYFKAYRKENDILLVNAVTVVLSLILSAFAVLVCNSLDLAVISIVILMIFKSVFAEWIMKKYVTIHVWMDNLLEIGLTVIFIVSSMVFSEGIAFFSYLVAYVAYLLIRRKKIGEQFKKAKEIISKK